MTRDADTTLIEELRSSFRLQLGWYSALSDTVDRILSRLILSRGDFSSVKGEFAEKQRLLECIENERSRTAPLVMRWQERKALASVNEAAKDLDRILQETESAIKRFLDGEEQLKRYLERMMGMGPTPLATGQKP